MKSDDRYATTRESFPLPINSADIQLAFGSNFEASPFQSFPSSVHLDSAFPDFAPLADRSSLNFNPRSAGITKSISRRKPTQGLVFSLEPLSAEYDAGFTSIQPIRDARDVRPPLSTIPSMSSIASTSSSHRARTSPHKQHGSRPPPAAPGIDISALGSTATRGSPSRASPKKKGFRAISSSPTSSSDEESDPFVESAVVPSMWAPRAQQPVRSVFGGETTASDDRKNTTAKVSPSDLAIASHGPKASSSQPVERASQLQEEPRPVEPSRIVGLEQTETSAAVSKDAVAWKEGSKTEGHVEKVQMGDVKRILASSGALQSQARTRRGQLPLLFIPPPPRRFQFYETPEQTPAAKATVSSPHSRVGDRNERSGDNASLRARQSVYPSQGSSPGDSGAAFDIPSAFAACVKDQVSAPRETRLDYDSLVDGSSRHGAELAPLSARTESTTSESGIPTAVDISSHSTASFERSRPHEVSRFSISSDEMSSLSSPSDSDVDSGYDSYGSGSPRSTLYQSEQTRRTSSLDGTGTTDEPSTPTPSEHAAKTEREEAYFQDVKDRLSLSKHEAPAATDATASSEALRDVQDVSTPHPPMYQDSHLRSRNSPKIARMEEVTYPRRMTRYMFSEFERTLALLDSGGEPHPLPGYKRTVRSGEATIARGPHHAFHPAPSFDPILVWRASAMPPMPMHKMTPSARRRLLKRWEKAFKHGGTPPSYTSGDMPDDMKRHLALKSLFRHTGRGSMAMSSDGSRTPSSTTSSSHSSGPRFFRKLRRGRRTTIDMDDMNMSDMDMRDLDRAREMMDMDDEMSVLSMSTTPTTPTAMELLEATMAEEAELEATEGMPTVEAIPGRPLLNNGHILVYPEDAALCEHCANIGFMSGDGHDHGKSLLPCKVCWSQYAKPFGSLLARFFRKGGLDGVKDAERIQSRLQRPLSAPSYSSYTWSYM